MVAFRSNLELRRGRTRCGKMAAPALNRDSELTSDRLRHPAAIFSVDLCSAFSKDGFRFTRLMLNAQLQNSPDVENRARTRQYSEPRGGYCAAGNRAFSWLWQG